MDLVYSGECYQSKHWHQVVNKTLKKKIIRARITFMPFVDASGTHAWVNRVLFLDWFQKEFIPAVCNHHLNVNLSPKALLDNCPFYQQKNYVVMMATFLQCFNIPILQRYSTNGSKCNTEY